MDENWGYPYVRKPPYDEMGCDNYILPETNEHVKLEEKNTILVCFLERSR
jgi:hypothetical protein